MSGAGTLQQVCERAKLMVIAGVLLLTVGLTNGSWLLGLAGLGVLVGFGWTWHRAGQTKGDEEPWPWPPGYRALAEGMASPIDPNPERIVPPPEKAAMIAEVVTTDEALQQLIADKPPAWPWAVFTSVVLQRRNGVQARLRTCASGYQPGSVASVMDGRAYSLMAYEAMETVADIVAQLEQFMLSPAFTGAFGGAGGERGADPDAIVTVADRLMDYHEALLWQAERCLQKPVEPEILAFVQDMGTFTLCPLLAYEQFIKTLCARIAEAQELLPYTDPNTTIALDDANLVMDLPDGLVEQIADRIKRFTS